MHSKQHFAKMHGLGNDFIVLDGVSQQLPALSTARIQALADRRLGIGFDQLLLLERAAETQSDFFYRIYNADGSEVGQCGNGVRCAHVFLLQHKLTDKQQLQFDTITTRINTRLIAPNRVRATMPPPQYKQQQQAAGYDFSYLTIGNPHYVTFGSEMVCDTTLLTVGKQINSAVAGGVNVGFAQLTPSGIQLRVYERGAGATAACGSGALAAAAVAIKDGTAANPVQVTMPGGSLLCGVEPDGSVWLEGDVTQVYDGMITL